MSRPEREEFKAVFDQVKTPESLKKETLRKMQKFEAAEGEEKMTDRREADQKASSAARTVRGRSVRYRKAGVCAALLCAACLALIVLRLPEKLILTPLEDGKVVEEVELTDGRLYFQKGRVDIFVTPNAGSISDGPQEEDDPAGDETEKTLDKKETASGGEIVKKELPDSRHPAASGTETSQIGGQELTLSYFEEEEIRYVADYVKDGTAYRIEGTAVSQKEFIEYLHREIKK